MNINNEFEAFWKRRLESAERPEQYAKGYIKELCRDAFRQGSKTALSKLFDKFDEYACIKDDKWYKDFKCTVMIECQRNEI